MPPVAFSVATSAAEAPICSQALKPTAMSAGVNSRRSMYSSLPESCSTSTSLPAALRLWLACLQAVVSGPVKVVVEDCFIICRKERK